MLFELGAFQLHSGGESSFRINCDALTPEDWAALAKIAADRLPPFGAVTGIYRGGVPFAHHLWKYSSQAGRNPLLLVDDVWTTGNSMRTERDSLGDVGEVIGCVVFARTPVDDWVTPLFQLTPERPSSG